MISIQISKNRKHLILLLFFIYSTQFITAQDEINLLIRADDIGSSHNANLACIEAYKNGIARSVEIMVPCAWFEEAVKLLNENPGFDVGIHLVLTSEWTNYKWRPLTHAPSITDEDGYFFPMIWPNNNFTENQSLRYANWDMQEVEKELRAQIELAMKKIPHISHLSSHMGWTSISEEFSALFDKLANEYDLEVNLEAVERLSSYQKGNSTKESIESFKNALENLQPGIYLFIEHPGFNTSEAKAIGHIGNDNVATDREMVTQLFTHSTIKKIITKKKINLIGYKDLK